MKHRTELTFEIDVPADRKSAGFDAAMADIRNNLEDALVTFVGQLPGRGTVWVAFYLEVDE